jgi:hypothetical protein
MLLLQLNVFKCAWCMLLVYAAQCNLVDQGGLKQTATGPSSWTGFSTNILDGRRSDSRHGMDGRLRCCLLSRTATQTERERESKLQRLSVYMLRHWCLLPCPGRWTISVASRNFYIFSFSCVNQPLLLFLVHSWTGPQCSQTVTLHLASPAEKNRYQYTVSIGVEKNAVCLRHKGE